MGFSGHLNPAARPAFTVWQVATIAERNALTEVIPGVPIIAADIGRICRVGEGPDYDYYELTGVSPNAWAAIGTSPSAATIKSLYEANADTNAFTDAAQSKLAGIEDGAAADQSAAEIKTAYESNPDTHAYADADKAKVDYLDVTQAVDLDTIEARVNALDAAVVLAGAWDASSGAFPGAAQAGYTYVVSVAGTVDGVVFAANDRLLALVDDAETGVFAGNWLKLDYTDQVLSVAGRSGNVSLAFADIAGLGSAAQADSNDFATAAQGSTADSALQQGDFGLGGNAINTPTTIQTDTTSGFYRITSGISGTPQNWAGGVGLAISRDLGITGYIGIDIFGRLFSAMNYRGHGYYVYSVWNTGNTTVDSNGFVKQASPIVRLFANRIDTNYQAESATFEKLNTGHYIVHNDQGFAQEGWTIETPRDANGNIKVFVRYQQNDDNSIEVWTFAPVYGNGGVWPGEPRDIPAGRWIDIRLQAPEPVTTPEGGA